MAELPYEPEALAALVRMQAMLADLLLAPDPEQALREHRSRAGAPVELGAIDADGLRLAALLVAKLRFQLLMNASSEANDWFARDGAGFTAAWKRYHHGVPPVALDPWREHDAFAAWCARQGLRTDGEPV